MSKKENAAKRRHEDVALRQPRARLVPLPGGDDRVRGLSVDESPRAYKDVERVLDVQVQAGLVRPVARMRPVAVIMAGEPGED